MQRATDLYPVVYCLIDHENKAVLVIRSGLVYGPLSALRDNVDLPLVFAPVR